MIIILCAIIIGFLGYFIFEHDPHPLGGWRSFIGGMLIIVSLISFVFILFIPINRMAAHANLQSMEEVRQLSEHPRDDWERAAYQQRISEVNEWLAGAKYWADSPFAIWWPEEIKEAEPIR